MGGGGIRAMGGDLTKILKKKSKSPGLGEENQSNLIKMPYPGNNISMLHT